MLSLRASSRPAPGLQHNRPTVFRHPCTSTPAPAQSTEQVHRAACFRLHAYSQPFNQEPTPSSLDFLGVRLERVTVTHDQEGYLVFVPCDMQGQWLRGSEAGLVVHVSGDSLYSLAVLLRTEEPIRPMPLDLACALLEHAGEHSLDNFGLLYVAIVAMRGSTYIASAFFGNRKTGRVTWERDVRPSDATYLAHQYNTPIYIDRGVWDDTALTYDALLDAEKEFRGSQQQPHPHGARPGDSEAFRQGETLPEGAEAAGSVPIDNLQRLAALPAGVLSTDPELVKMIKRQMAVAVAEEDYRKAAQLRDLPVMAVYHEIQQLELNGHGDEAKKLKQILDAEGIDWIFREDGEEGQEER